MNICLVSRELYPFQKAGIGVYINNLMNILSEYNHEVYIITSKANCMLYKSNEVKSNIHIFGVDILEESIVSNEPSIVYSLSVQKVLSEVCKKYSIDIVEFCDYFGEGFFPILFKKYRGMYKNIPFVIKLHTPTYECRMANREEILEDILTKQEDFSILNCDFIYAISNKMKQSIIKRLDVHDIKVVSNIIKLPIQKANEQFKKINGKYVLYVGRIEKRKGIDLYIDSAIKYLSNNDDDNIKFVIIGSDTKNKNGISQKSLLQKRIGEEYQKNFIWLEGVLQKELQMYYKNAYVSIFPSIYEGFGNVCVEAMQSGSPVIVSSDTGLEEITQKNKYGIIFKNSSSEDLYEKLVDILNNPDKREKLKSLSIERGNAFKGEYLYKEQIEYYRYVVSNYKHKVQLKEQLVDGEIFLEICEKSLTSRKEEIRVLNEWKESKKIIDILEEECRNREKEENRILSEWKKISIEVEDEKQKEKLLQINYNRVENNYKELENSYKELENSYKELEANCKKMEQDYINEKKYIYELEKNLSLFYKLKKLIQKKRFC